MDAAATPRLHQFVVAIRRPYFHLRWLFRIHLFHSGLRQGGYGISRKDFDVLDFEKLKNYINKNNFDIVVNCVAKLGIDPCELDPVNAHKCNAQLPRLLAEESNKQRFILVHFSSDAVFADNFNKSYNESDPPSPVNIYGYSKYCGDLFVKNIAERYYIIRIPLIFGFSYKKSQFFEKMVEKSICNIDIKIADDIITTPTYSNDVAKELFKIIIISIK